MTETAPHSASALIDELRHIVGPERVITAQAERDYYSHDLFFWDKHADPLAVIKPDTRAQVPGIVTAAARHDTAIYMRGGGMSYTNGYGPETARSIILDLSGLNRIIEVDPINRFIALEAGCTWAQVVQALSPHNMAVDFAPPLSGSHSTVGGALAQNVPSGMQGVLGLEVVRANGDVVRTGSWASRNNGKPYSRIFGPDLTGLFLGDNGTFGIKLAVGLHLKHRAKAQAFASFAFETYEAMATAMIELSPYDFITRRTGLDPYESQSIAKVSLKDAIAAAAKIAGQERGLTGGLKAMVEMAAGGLDFMAGVKWSMHLKVESHSDRAAEDGMAIVKTICAKHGREFPAILPRAREAIGFSIRKFLGKDGERWIATSSMWPLGRAVEVASATEAFFKAHKAEMERHGVIHSYVTNFGQHYFLSEPCFYWHDELSELHFRALPTDEAKRFKALSGKPDTRAFVRELREKLRQLFFDMGAIHVQIGGFYDFTKAIEPTTLSLLQDLKGMLDPEGRLSPGKMGGLRGRK
ncbi:MAG: FAD-binding oxidoreductase [Rhodospirillaceae bacterium]|nr:FAD-binding oxidoreductase [Rhodospirillaceae bacterium]